MGKIVEGLVAVKMPSKFDDTIRIKLEDGDWYGASQEMADKMGKGDSVKLKVEKRGKNTMVQAVKVLSKGQGDSGGSGGSGGGRGRYTPDPAREASIHYQSSRKDALALLALQQDAGILKLGTKAAEKEAVLLAKLDVLTAQFHEDIATLGAVKRVAEQTDEADEFDPDSEMEEEAATEAEDDDFDDEEDF